MYIQIDLGKYGKEGINLTPYILHLFFVSIAVFVDGNWIMKVEQTEKIYILLYAKHNTSALNRHMKLFHLQAAWTASIVYISPKTVNVVCPKQENCDWLCDCASAKPQARPPSSTKANMCESSVRAIVCQACSG